MPPANCRTRKSADAESRPERASLDRRPGIAQEAALLAQYAPIVLQIASGFQRRLPRNVLRDDLVAAGMSGLWDAVAKHGRDKGESFDWYVRVRVRGAILDELRAQDWLPRRARAAAAEAAVASGGAAPSAPVVVRFDDVSETEASRCLMATQTPSGEEHLVEQHTRAVVAEAVERLPERERHIVSLHYFKGVKFKDLGKMLGVSEPRISQLHSRAIDRLKVMLAQEAA